MALKPQRNDIAAQVQPATIIVGLGVTGLSCARFLTRQGLDFAIADSRSAPPLSGYRQGGDA